MERGFLPKLSLLSGCIFFIITFVLADDKNNEYTYRAHYEIKDILTAFSIIPDVINDAPEHKIEVIYNGDGYSGDAVEFGNVLTLDQIQKPPRIRWPALSSLLYTLVLMSPDYPSRENQTEKEWQYWLVTNIPGYDVSMGEVMTEYAPPTSLEGKGPIRMIFLAYMQRTSHLVKFEEPRFKKEVICLERAHFSIKKFAEKYNFKELIGVNFFQLKPVQNTTKPISKRKQKKNRPKKSG